jgi:hypothetical protein
MNNREQREEMTAIVIKMVGDMDAAMANPSVREFDGVKQAIQDAAEAIWKAMKDVREVGR